MSSIATTPRLRLRALRAADAPVLTVLANDADVARMTTSIPHPFTVGQAEAFIERMRLAEPSIDRVFAIDLIDGGLAGVIGFHRRDRPAFELGYWLGRPFWRRGIMTEAVRCAVDWAGEAMGVRWLVAGHFEDNPASGRILCRSGFLYTGEVLARHSLARDDRAPTRMMVWLR